MKKNITNGEKYGPAMEITDQLKAGQYFEELVQHSMSFGNSREEAEAIEKQNLGYYAGYYDSQTRARVEILFNTKHPYFGAIAEGQPTQKEAYEMGKKLGEQARKEKP